MFECKCKSRKGANRRKPELRGREESRRFRVVEGHRGNRHFGRGRLLGFCFESMFGVVRDILELQSFSIFSKKKKKYQKNNIKSHFYYCTQRRRKNGFLSLNFQIYDIVRSLNFQHVRF